jgi:hypothetical protein
MSCPVPLSSYILVFEVVSLVGMPVVLGAIRWASRLKIVAKVWGGTLVLGVLLQIFAVGYQRTYSFPVRWSLEVPDEIRSELVPVPGFANQAPVVFSRPPLTEELSGKHACYQVIFSDALAKRLQEMHRDIVDLEYDVTFRFDTPIFYHSPRLKGDDRNTTVGGMGYMSQVNGTSGYTCFPPAGMFD